jgi:hypothetical protein
MVAAGKHVSAGVATTNTHRGGIAACLFPLGDEGIMRHCCGAISATDDTKGDVMNAVIRKVSGTYSVVQFVPDDKLDQLAALLGLDDAAKAKLKANGPTIVVLDDDGKSAG